MMTMTVDDILRKYRGTDNRKAPEESDVKADLLDLRNSQKAGTAAITPHTDRQPVGQKNFPNHKNGASISAEREKQIEFCHMLWEGASEKVTRANAEAGSTGQTAADDPAFREEDLTLRRKILDQLQNPNVKFRDLAFMIYRWRDMHLNRIMPKKQSLSVPSWQPPTCGARGGDEGKHES
jgi:hypothetical protein